MELKEIDLSRGKGHTHPDFKPYPVRYLVKIGQHFHAGSFGFYTPQNRWTFQGGPFGSYQYDTPGSNSSNWTKVWEIIETEEEKGFMNDHEIAVAKREAETEALYNSLTENQKYWFENDYEGYDIRDFIREIS